MQLTRLVKIPNILHFSILTIITVEGDSNNNDAFDDDIEKEVDG